MKTSTKRDKNRMRQQRQKWKNYALIGGAVLLVLGVLGIFIWQGARQAIGEVVSIPADYGTHVDVGTPLTFPSDPPAGGRHYAQTFDAGFYDENNLPNLPGDPAGYMVHNLEHGYVIFWYNCENLEENTCAELKTNIKEMMDARNNLKLIAFPWTSVDAPLVMTSWGRLQRFEQFDARLAKAFIDGNLNRAPESNAP
jgi:hypothetical protein